MVGEEAAAGGDGCWGGGGGSGRRRWLGSSDPGRGRRAAGGGGLVAWEPRVVGVAARGGRGQQPPGAREEPAAAEVPLRPLEPAASPFAGWGLWGERGERRDELVWIKYRGFCAKRKITVRLDLQKDCGLNP